MKPSLLCMLLGGILPAATLLIDRLSLPLPDGLLRTLCGLGLICCVTGVFLWHRSIFAK